MQRRKLIRRLASAGALACLGPGVGGAWAAISADGLPPLEGELTLYLGRGEGGLYEKVLAAIEQRNPNFSLAIRRGPTAALANAIDPTHRTGALVPGARC